MMTAFKCFSATSAGPHNIIRKLYFGVRARVHTRRLFKFKRIVRDALFHLSISRRRRWQCTVCVRLSSQQLWHVDNFCELASANLTMRRERLPVRVRIQIHNIYNHIIYVMHTNRHIYSPYYKCSPSLCVQFQKCFGAAPMRRRCRTKRVRNTIHTHTHSLRKCRRDLRDLIITITI